MQNSFKRALWLPILELLTGLGFLITGGTLIVFGKWPGIIQVLIGMFAVVQAVWLFSSPLIKIENGMFYHNKALFGREDMELKHVVKVNNKSFWCVELVFFNGHVEKIKLLYMAFSEHARFKKTITEFIDIQQSTVV